MDIQFFRENWLWIGAFELAAAANLAISGLALWQSMKAVRMSIPAPEVQKAYAELIVIKMGPSDGNRFAISRIRDSRGRFWALPDFTVRELEDFLKGSAGRENPVNSMIFANPAKSLIVYPDMEPNGGLQVRVVCRADPKAGRWITIFS
jgi:hypothetical protein